MRHLDQTLGRYKPLHPDRDWVVVHSHKFIDTLGAHVQADDIQRALIRADDLRNDALALLKKTEAVIKTQEFKALFEEFSNDVDGSLNNFVHTIGRVYDAMEQAGIPARRG